MSATQLHQRLGTVQRGVLRAGVRTAGVWTLVAGMLVWIAAMWLDLVVELPPVARLGSGLLALIVAMVLLGTLWVRARRRIDPHVLAMKLDEAGRSRGEIFSGVDLALRPTAGGALTAGLSMIAVDRALTLMARVPVSAVLPRKEEQKPIGVLLLMALGVSLIGIVAPRLIAAQWLRFVDPFGDHPPYSPLIFNLDPGDTSVVFGGTVEVKVSVSGGRPERVVLMLESGGKFSEPLPMFPEPDGMWRASVADVVASGNYYAVAGSARSHRYKLGVVTVPRIESVSFTVRWPAYTNRPPYTGPLPQGGLTGLPGTIVQVNAKSNRDLSRGVLSFTPTVPASTTQPALALDMIPVSGNAKEVSGSFEITSPGVLSATVTDVEGQTSTDEFKTPVGVLKDGRPFVRMIEPQANSFATPDVTLQVVAQAEDDFGVARVLVFRALNDTRPRPTEIAVPDKRPTQFRAVMPLPLSQYGLQPGDVVKLFARVEDNDPAGSKGGESSVITVHIVSQQEMDSMILAREGLEALESKYAQAARRMEALADRAEKLKDELAKLDPNGELADAKRKELDQLANDMESAASEVEKLADHTLPIDLDKALTKELAKAAAALRSAAEETKAAGQAGIGAARASEKLAAASRALGKGKNELKENAQDPLDHLAAIFPLLEDQGRFIDLAEQQRDLAGRISALAGQSGQDDAQLKPRMRDLLDQQEQIRKDLQTLLADIEDHANKLPDDAKLDDLRKTARAFADAMRRSDAQSEMRKSEDALADFAGTRAQLASVGAAAALEKLIGKCNGMGEQAEACLKFQPKLASALGNTVSQLLASEGLPSMGKMGSGSGGYSARRSSLKNVGLYGNLPVRGSETSKSGNGKADRGNSTRSDGLPDANANPDGSTGGGVTQASGQSDAAVPQQYKARVGDYFRRVADELEQ